MTPAASGGGGPRALVVTNMWPTAADPAFGIFVRDQVEALETRLRLARRRDEPGPRAIDVIAIDGRRSRLAYAAGILRVRRALARADRTYAVVHAHHALAGLAAILAGARRPGRPLVVTHHGIEVLEGWQAPLCRWVSRRADLTLVTSPELAVRLSDLQARVEVVPCGIDRALFRPGDRARARAELGLPAEGALVAWVGTDRPEKRLGLARAAVERLREDGSAPAVRLVEVSGRAHTEVPTWLRAADALLLTSTAEGSPLVVREALACGVPVVSTAVGDVPKLLDGLPGCTVVAERMPAGTRTPGTRRPSPAGRPPPAGKGPADEGADVVKALAAGLRWALDFTAGGGHVTADEVLAEYDGAAIADRVWRLWRVAIDKTGERSAHGAVEGSTDAGKPWSMPSPHVTGSRRPTVPPRSTGLTGASVLIVRHAGYPADPRVRREAAALVAAGYRVEVMCAIEPGQRRRERVDGVDVIRLPVRHLRRGPLRYLFEYGAFFACAAGAIAWRSIRRPWALVQVNTLPDALVFAAIGARLRGSAVLLDLHELMPELYASKYGVSMDHPLPRVLGWLEQRAIAFADHALAVSAPCLDRYVRRGADRRRFTIVMNVADPALFGPAARATAPAPVPVPVPVPVSARIGEGEHDPGRPLVVSHGTLVARYGFDILLRAMVEVRDADLEIIGDGPERASLERLADELGIAGRVRFTGRLPLDEVPKAVARAAVGVVSNRSDPFTDLVVPTKLMEYVALGIPAVVARTPAVEAYFDPGAVRFVAPGDPRDLARALRVLIEEPDLRQAIARRADETFGADHAWAEVAARYTDVVGRLAGRLPRA